MLILLPPSEGKSDAGGTGIFADNTPSLEAETKGVLKQLRALDKDKRRKWYGARNDEIAATAHKKNLAVLKAGCLPAIERYTGVVCQHIDYPSLRAKKRAGSRVIFVSAMWGLIPAATPIPDYKLPMNPALAKYWRDINAERLSALAKGGPVLSLLPQAYSKALEYPDLITVDFKVSGGKKSAGHFGKAIKGKFVRYLLENNVARVEDFAGFREDGYVFDGTDFVQP